MSGKSGKEWVKELCPEIHDWQAAAIGGCFSDYEDEIKELKEALQWALANGINVNDYGNGQPYTFQNSGCGCCAYEVTVPEDIEFFVHEAARVVVEKQNDSP